MDRLHRLTVAPFRHFIFQSLSQIAYVIRTSNKEVEMRSHGSISLPISSSVTFREITHYCVTFFRHLLIKSHSLLNTAATNLKVDAGKVHEGKLR